MNAAERKSIRRAEKAAAEIERARIEFVVAAMSTTQGRVYFHNLLSACSIFDGSFSGDALVEAFTKGQRNIGLMIYNDIVTHSPDEFVLMMKEAQIQEVINDRRLDADSDGDPAAEYPGSEES